MPKQDRAIRTPAIILRRRDLGEADRLLTILTPDHGKFDVVAHGARKPKSRKTGHVELFARTDMLVNRRREPGTVTQVELMEPYLPIREDLTRGAYASYVVELLDRFTQVGDEDMPTLFGLLNATLTRLCAEPDPRLVTRYFEMRLMDLVGFRPELNECVVSRDDIQPQDQFFSFEGGGVVSPEYASSNLARISLNTLKLMRHMQRSGYQQVGSLRIAERLHAELEAIMLGYITYLLERNLQSVEFIRRIRRLA